MQNLLKFFINMENQINDRLRKLIKKERLTQKKFCETIDIKESSLNDMFYRDYHPNTEVLVKISDKFPQYSMNWLLTGNGEMETLKDKENTFSISQLKKRGYAPYYPELLVSGGQYDLATISSNEEPESWIKLPGVTAEGWFPIIGCSMEPKIYPGDTIGVISVNNYEKLDPDKTYLIVTKDERMIKHLLIDEERSDIIWAVSENYPKFKIYVNDIIRIFRVVWAGRLV